MKRFLAALLASAMFVAGAQAQVNVVPSVGLTTGYLPKATYSAAFFGLVPVVTSGTDLVCIAGSASKTIRVQRIIITGTTATAPQVLPLNLVRRVFVDTGGTLGTTTANPNNNIAKRDVTTAAATATLAAYTAAPTIVDSSPTYLDSQVMTMPLVAGVTVGAVVADFNYSRDVENLLQVPTLVGAAAQICVNNSVAITNASLWNGVIVWTEE